MAGKSDYLENKSIDHNLGTTTFTKPTAVYMALYTAAPSDAGGGTEVSGNAYARTAATWNAASGGSTTNAALVQFPQATGSWGTITHFGIFDASTAGNLLYWAALSASKTIGNTDRAEFAAGTLTVTED